MGDTPADSQSHVWSHMHFLEKTELYDKVKPYSLRFPPKGSLPQSNVRRERHDLTFVNMRQRPDLTFHQCGFEAVEAPSSLTYEDFDDRRKIRGVSLQETCEFLRNKLHASHVLALDFSVRRRHEEFPVSTGKDYSHDQPTAMAHIDFTTEEGERMVRILYGSESSNLLKHQWQIVKCGVYSNVVNVPGVWRPLRGPLNDWPLGLCDSRTVDFASDTMPGDIVYVDFVTENLQVHYNPKQEWFYLPGQKFGEALMFKSAESEHGASQACPHAGFYNPLVSGDEGPRESIDCRFMVFYAPFGEYPAPVGDIYHQRH